MKELPKTINNTEELEELLSQPSEKLIDFMKQLDGDIMVLGAGGKIGPTLTTMAKRAIDAAKVDKKLIAVDLFELPKLKQQGIETITADLVDHQAVGKLPKIKNIIYMAGRKFGSTGSEWLTWSANVMIPYNVASTFLDSRIVVFSTGCVYPVVHVDTGGSIETDPPDPIGEYSISCLGRERMFDYFSHEKGEKIIQIRLYYALETRYGVLVDIATKVFNNQPVDVTTGYFNGIWQGDACEMIIRSLPLASSPPEILNLTGPETASVRQVAQKFGQLMQKKVTIEGTENGLGYLANTKKAQALFGKPAVTMEKIIEWVAHWVQKGGENIGKPTHFETQDGKY